MIVIIITIFLFLFKKTFFMYKKNGNNDYVVDNDTSDNSNKNTTTKVIDPVYLLIYLFSFLVVNCFQLNPDKCTVTGVDGCSAKCGPGAQYTHYMCTAGPFGKGRYACRRQCFGDNCPPSKYNLLPKTRIKRTESV